MSQKAKCALPALFVLLLSAFLFLPRGVSAAEADSRGGEVIEHTVRAGDNLMLLAGYYYKDPRRWKRIYDANSSAITDPSVIRTGMLLRIVPDPARQWNIPYSEYLSRVYN